MSADTAVAEPTPEELRAKLEELDANVTALNAKRETLTERASRCTKRAAEIRQELAREQLAEDPDEKAMKRLRSEVADNEIDADSSNRAAEALRATIAEAESERRSLDADVKLAAFEAACAARDAADTELGDALLALEETLRPAYERFNTLQARCSAALWETRVALQAAGREGLTMKAEDRVNTSAVPAPAWWRASSVLDSITGIREGRGLVDSEHPVVYVLAGANQRLAQVLADVAR